MKPLFLITVTMLVAGYVGSQTLRIRVYESIEYSVFDSIDVFSAISNVFEATNLKQVDCEYFIDLDHNRSAFYRDGVLESELDITIKNQGYIYIVGLMVEGFDGGFIINTDIQNETFNWYSRVGDYYDISKAINFEIVKAQ
jgi:hypothetical protein